MRAFRLGILALVLSAFAGCEMEDRDDDVGDEGFGDGVDRDGIDRDGND
jgi:hypothetical protein